MDSSIHRVVPRARIAARRASDQRRQPEREFLLPSEEEGGEGEVVLEPRPRQDRGDLTVSRTRLSDEAGQNIDIQG
ncbi:MAG: hypothetical protein VX460_03660 [Planctomycetota bacterium]|nr:hypothetical protein [Planctomycetota bacterium]